MKICFFGIYNPDYARNRVLMTGLIEHGHDIVECRVDPRQEKGFGKYWKLYKLSQALNKKEIDAVVVAFPGHTVVWLARLIFGKKIIFDAFLSLFDSNVSDRKLYKPWSLRGRRDWLLDWYSAMLSLLVIVDTRQHIQFFHTIFHVPMHKLLCVFIGADTTLFYPRHGKKSTEYIVHFHGNFIPLQGLEYIVDAALLVEEYDVIVQIVGDGQEGEKIRAKIAQSGKGKNIRLIGKVPVKDVPAYIAAADICLGIFGNTEKTQRVIPNKVYECLAMSRPVITARTPALQELFVDRETVLMTNVADAHDLAEKIIYLKRNPHVAYALAEKGYAFFQENLTPKEIVLPIDLYLQSHHDNSI